MARTTANLGVYSAVKLGPCKNPARGTVIAEAPRDPVTDVPAEIKALWVPGEVAIVFRCVTPIRQLSQESLASFRKKRLKSRLETRYPLFAEQLFERETAARPGFFRGER